MSTFNVKSTLISNRDASPKVLTDNAAGVGALKVSMGADQLPQTASAGSTVKLCTVPSSARLNSLEYCAAAIGTSALDIGVWYPNYVAGGAALASSLAGTLISSSQFAANLAGVDAGVAWTDGFGLPSVHSVTKRQQPLWQAIGLTSDPLIDLDLGFSVRTANSIAGYVGLRATFVE